MAYRAGRALVAEDIGYGEVVADASSWPTFSVMVLTGSLVPESLEEIPMGVPVLGVRSRMIRLATHLVETGQACPESLLELAPELAEISTPAKPKKAPAKKAATAAPAPEAESKED